MSDGFEVVKTQSVTPEKGERYFVLLGKICRDSAAVLLALSAGEDSQDITEEEIQRQEEWLETVNGQTAIRLKKEMTESKAQEFAERLQCAYQDPDIVTAIQLVMQRNTKPENQ